MTRFLLIFSLALFLVSCSTDPQPINWGKDICSYCEMTVVDKQHAAQYVTKKGKQYKFDAIECMVRDILERKNLRDVEVFRSASYGKSEMIDAIKATYLISPKIKSPMGEFLSAFPTLEMAKSTKDEQSGELYSWEELLKYFRDKE